MSFTLSADAPAFVPAALRAGAAAAPEVAEAAAAPAPAPPADPARVLRIETLGADGAKRSRMLTMRGMAGARTESLEKGPFADIGTVYRGYDHDDDADSLPEDDEAIAIGCHDNDYRVKTIVRPIVGVAELDAGDFPNNIREYFWINDGKNDEHPWYVLGRLANDAYFYFAASCGFSGFECQGQMALYLANDLQTLYDHGMDGAARLRFASCFDKGTREKLKADAAAAKAARVAAAKARQAAAAKPRPAATTYAAQKARMAAGQAALQASFAAGRAAAAAAGGGGGGASAAASKGRAHISSSR